MWDFETAGKGAGERVEFGGMSWLVLDKAKDGSKQLLLAVKHFSKSWLPEDYIEREKQNGDFTWETSCARAYLNGQYFKENFTDAERAQICEVRLENKGNPFEDSHDSGKSNDKVFMLSFEEALHYLSVNQDAKNLVIIEDELFYTRTPLNHKWPVSPIHFYLEEDHDRFEELDEMFPDADGVVLSTLNAWTDVTEDEIRVRPAMWVAL